MGASTALRVALGGTAVVCCVHDRQKSQVVTEAQVVALGAELGIEYDPAQHRFHSCSCCRNLFLEESDVPRYCRTCQGPPVHLLAGPLPEPTGVLL